MHKAPPPHHEVFSKFECWEGRVPKGFIPNFLGVMTRADYYVGYADLAAQYVADEVGKTEYPPFDEEYFEWIDLLEAIVSAERNFTMLELGAGFGRWTANAAAALRHLGNPPHTLIAVEAEPTHFHWMTQHFADNSVDPGSLRLIQAAVGCSDGKIGFHVGETRWGGPASWYGQSIGGSFLVDAVSLHTLLGPFSLIDLIDVDVQGAELEVLGAAAEDIDAKVKKIHVGTHSTSIDEGLLSLFSRLGWRCLHYFPCATTAETEWGTISFQDGVQTWANPAFANPVRDVLTVLREKLDRSRAEGKRLWLELDKTRQQINMARMQGNSLAWRTIDAGRRIRDRIAPSGTRRRTMLDLIVGKR